MRVKTSITVSHDLLKRIDQRNSSRSAFIERACRTYLERVHKVKRETGDIKIINSRAGLLSCEAQDVLEYQAWP